VVLYGGHSPAESETGPQIIATTRMRFKSPGELDQFVTVVRRELDESRLPDAARLLATVQETAFTTSSEWLGELGAAVTSDPRGDGDTTKLDDKLEIIMQAVRRAWPAFRQSCSV
jgi:hypothetical protein